MPELLEIRLLESMLPADLSQSFALCGNVAAAKRRRIHWVLALFLQIHFRRAYETESLPVPESDSDPIVGVHRTGFAIVLSLHTTTL